MWPAGSAAGPAPLIHTAPSDPFGVTFNTLVCASVPASYAMIHPVYGRLSQCEAQAVITMPLRRSSADRSVYCLGSKMTEVPSLLSPVPGKEAWIVFGLPKSFAPLATSSAYRRWEYVPEPSFDIAMTYIAPFGPRARSITGVAVMPISGSTCEQPPPSPVVSPGPSSETCQSSAPVLAS